MAINCRDPETLSGLDRALFVDFLCRRLRGRDERPSWRTRGTMDDPRLLPCVRTCVRACERTCTHFRCRLIDAGPHAPSQSSFGRTFCRLFVLLLFSSSLFLVISLLRSRERASTTRSVRTVSTSRLPAIVQPSLLREINVINCPGSRYRIAIRGGMTITLPGDRRRSLCGRRVRKNASPQKKNAR